MSVKYSNSPALRLRVASSLICRGLQLACVLCLLCALYLLFNRGYPLLALGLAPLLYVLARHFIRGPGVEQLCWCQGNWEIERAGVRQPVAVCASSTCLSWVIYFAWRELPSGRRGALWLFADSAPGEQLRRLRVRLALQR